ncbi:RimK/LysX family protein [Photobacterium damselae subsp. damselae]|nr:RimK/LysX family protein [Photobacterium damselae]UKA04403.1 RimK/LysX family protein [Photobacterium damselae subsp. damselae]
MNLRAALILLGCSMAVVPSTYGSKADHKMVGAVEKITVDELGFDYLARIDTGAATSSIHAYDIEVPGSDNDNMRKHIGMTVEFKTRNENGQYRKHKSKIIRVSKIRNAQGVERRYSIYLTLRLDEGRGYRRVKVNLRNRSKLGYKLLIGRNWLKGRYVVDVSK